MSIECNISGNNALFIYPQRQRATPETEVTKQM
uniref:Uncharacterized protein n=1 Tax=Rhizophora mucronata TaxID=61149 RepID=A0A2P2PZ55_RHIMU